MFFVIGANTMIFMGIANEALDTLNKFMKGENK
jgi:hypothetical protein